MMQSIRARLSQNRSSENQSFTSDVPTSWPASGSYQSIDHAISRTNSHDVEKGSFVAEKTEKNELRPLLTAASRPHTALAALEIPKTRQTILRMMQPALDYKGPEDIAAIRRRAEKHRDARFAQHTASLLTEVNRAKPGDSKKRFFVYANSWPETEENLIFEATGLTDRFAALERIHISIEPDKCRFNKEQAELYAYAILSEFNLVWQAIDLEHKHAPKMIELLTSHVVSFIDAIRCDVETKQEIDKSVGLTVTHMAWRLAEEAQNSGRTHHLERYLLLHKLWQDRSHLFFW